MRIIIQKIRVKKKCHNILVSISWPNHIKTLTLNLWLETESSVLNSAYKMPNLSAKSKTINTRFQWQNLHYFRLKNTYTRCVFIISDNVQNSMIFFFLFKFYRLVNWFHFTPAHIRQNHQKGKRNALTCHRFCYPKLPCINCHTQPWIHRKWTLMNNKLVIIIEYWLLSALRVIHILLYFQFLYEMIIIIIG